MRKVTISCDGCKSPCPQQHSSGGVLDRTWLEMHVTHGNVTHIDLAFCAVCKDNERSVYRTMMRRLAEQERKISDLREAVARETIERAAERDAAP